MKLFDRILREKLVDESLLRIVFGAEQYDGEWEDANDVMHPYDLPGTAYNVCLFYFALIQGCYIGQALQLTCKLQELAASPKVIAPIADMWKENRSCDFSYADTLFSYLLGCADFCQEDILPASAKPYIAKVRDTYKKYKSTSSVHSNLLSEEFFIGLLQNLPLLRNTRFDSQQMRLHMQLENQEIAVKCSPFLSFLSFEDNELGTPVDYVTKNCFILLSVSKGDKNDELYFDTIELNGYNTPRKVRVWRNVINNENLVLICQAVDITTKWYPVEDYWCDYTFLTNLIDVAEDVLLKHFLSSKYIDKEIQAQLDITPKFLEIFEDTEMFSSMPSGNRITVKDLKGVLRDLLLSEGLFKTIRSILYNPGSSTHDRNSNKLLFDKFSEGFVQFGMISPAQRDEYKSQCAAKIQDSLQRLAHIVTVESGAYQKRSLEIRAEWETFYLLQMAGIKNEKLFADVEKILSIDDFYDMLANPGSTIEQDLQQVLYLLNCFYGALLKNSLPFNEKKYYKDLAKLCESYAPDNNTLESMFDTFSQIVQKCSKSDVIEKLLGRRMQWQDVDKLLNFHKKDILDKLNSGLSLNENPACGNHTVFISYAHEDKSTVKACVERWRDRGIRMFFDETDIHCGDNWRAIADSAMDNDNCKMVVVFMSKNAATSAAVKHELEHAQMIASRKFPLSAQKAECFIVPINLEADSIDSYLKVFEHNIVTPRISQDESDCAKAIREILSAQKVFIDFRRQDTAVIDDTIQKQYELLIDSEGRVIAPFEYSDVALAVANFYYFLKYGAPDIVGSTSIDSCFNDDSRSLSKCIFPIVASLKETRIKRDNIALVGYEMIKGKGRKKMNLRYILSTKKYLADEYYCIPHYRSDESGLWMVEPLLIQCDRFIEILSQNERS